MKKNNLEFGALMVAAVCLISPTFAALASDAMAPDVDALRSEIQGVGDSGGGQGVFDRTGKLYFLDTINRPINELLPARTVDLISAIPCTNEMYRDLKDYQFEDPEARALFEKVYAPEGKFESEMKAAELLLTRASKVLIGHTETVPGLEYYMDKSRFKSTAFKLPQIADAAGTIAQYQIQLAYYQNGLIFFQEQAMRLLGTQARGVFVKETLRLINRAGDMRLRNRDLEKATFYIVNGKLEDLQQSVFARRWRTYNPFAIDNVGKVNMANYNWRGYTDSWLGNVESAYYTLGDFEMAGQYLRQSAPAGKSWLVKTGELLSTKECQKRSKISTDR